MIFMLGYIFFFFNLVKSFKKKRITIPNFKASFTSIFNSTITDNVKIYYCSYFKYLIKDKKTNYFFSSHQTN